MKRFYGLCVVCLCLCVSVGSADEVVSHNTISTNSTTSASAMSATADAAASAQTNSSHSFVDMIVKQVSLQGFGDVAQFLPVVSLGYSAFVRDFVGVKQQAIGWAAVIISTYAIKYTLHFLSPFSPKLQSLTQRPDSDDKFEGFPSGHTASAFAAAGFLQKRYGVRLGLPAVVVASVVGLSRIHAERHTAVQVICGGLLGFFVSFFCARLRRPTFPHSPHSHSSHAHTSSITTRSLLFECALLSLVFV